MSEESGAVSQGLALHGAWVAAGNGFAARFALWGERVCGEDGASGEDRASAADQGGAAEHVSAADRRSGERGGAAAGEWTSESGGAGATAAIRTYAAHPFAVSTQRLQGALGAAVGDAEAQPWPLPARLPSAGEWPLAGHLSSGARGSASASTGERAGRCLWSVPALCFVAGAAAEVLLALGRAPLPDVVLAHDVRCWIVAARFGLDLLKRQRLAPVVERDERRGAYLACWRPLFDQEGDRSRLDALTWAMPASSAALAWDGSTTDAAALPPAVALRDFLHALVDGVARAGLSAPDVLAGAPTGAVTPMGWAWLAALSGDPVLHGDPHELDGLARRCRDWLAQLPSLPAGTVGPTGHGGQPGPTEQGGFRVCFRLEPPLVASPLPSGPVPSGIGPSGIGPNALDATSEIQEPRRWTLRYLLQAADDRSLLLPAALVWREASATSGLSPRRAYRSSFPALRPPKNAALISRFRKPPLRRKVRVASVFLLAGAVSGP